MKAIKFTALAVLLMIVLLVSSYSQDTNNNSFKKQIYFQAGCTYVSVKSNSVKSMHDGNFGFIGSIGYQIKPRLRFCVNYVYEFDTYDNRKFSYVFNPPDYVYSQTYKGITAQKLSLGASYFLTIKPGHLMTFLSGALVNSFERAKTYSEQVFAGHSDSTGQYDTYQVRKVTEQHNRFLMGPEIGVGIFMELGRFNFQQELTFTKMFSIYNDRNYSEFSVNFNSGIVYKF